MDDALSGASAAGYDGKQGADADHLKTPADVDRTAAAGFCFFTIDPSDYVDQPASGDDVAWIDNYRGKRIKLSTETTVDIDDATVDRAAKKYGAAVNHAVALARHIDQVMRAAKRD